jgi:hypothetical protein
MVLPVLAVPWILGGLSAAAGAFGLKKGVDAKNNFARSKSIVEDAEDEFRNSQARLEKTKLKVSDSLKNLGVLRIETEATDMKRFVEIVQQINQAAYTPIVLGGNNALVSMPVLREIEVASYQAQDMLKDGVVAVSSGVLIGVGASGLATSLGAVASTGTLIGSLSGVAASNATLAWLGGGSLATGGMGMAGGTAILGGVIAGPALAIIGYAAASKSEKALTEAYSKESEIREGTEQIDNGNALLLTIRERSEEVRTVVLSIRERFSGVLYSCEQMLMVKKALKLHIDTEWNNAGFFTKLFRKIFRKKPKNPLDFFVFSQQEKDIYSMLNLFGIALYRMIKVRILDESGLVTEESDRATVESRTLLLGR